MVQRCEQFLHEDLIHPRIGGVGSILQTLFHIVDVEHAWIKMNHPPMRSRFMRNFIKAQMLLKTLKVIIIFITFRQIIKKQSTIA